MSFASLRLAPSSIWVRLAIWYSGFFILGAIVLFALANILLSSLLTERDEYSIRAELNELSAQYRSVGLEALRATHELQERTGTAEPFLIRLLGPDGTTRFDRAGREWARFDRWQLGQPEATAEGRLIRLEKRDPGEYTLEVLSTQLPDGATLQVGKTTKERERILGRFRGTVWRTLLPVAVVGVVGSAFLASWALRPIRQIIDTVQAIQAGSLEARVPIRNTGDELDELGTLFNGMLDRIAKLIPLMRGALDNVAHDLRTPITRIRGVAEMALRSEKHEACAAALADCVEESDRLLIMLNTLMDISEAETGSLALKLEPVDLTKVLEEVVELYRYVSEAANVAVAAEAPANLVVMADRNRVRQVVANLLDNAIKYTLPGGRVELRAARLSDAVVISVSDTGIGMTPDELPKIWDRLYRGSHSRAQRGLGLGLSLVRAVIHAHGGRVDVSSTLGEGSTFRISLPLVGPSFPAM